MNVELVAQMFKNYQSNVLFHLEGRLLITHQIQLQSTNYISATDNLKEPS